MKMSPSRIASRIANIRFQSLYSSLIIGCSQSHFCNQMFSFLFFSKCSLRERNHLLVEQSILRGRCIDLFYASFDFCFTFLVSPYFFNKATRPTNFWCQRCCYKKRKRNQENNDDYIYRPSFFLWVLFGCNIFGWFLLALLYHVYTFLSIISAFNNRFSTHAALFIETPFSFVAYFCIIESSVWFSSLKTSLRTVNRR